MRILVTDGMDKTAMAQLREAGHEVVEQFYEPDQLGAALKEFDAVVVRSKTKVRANHIDEAKGGKLKLIIRGGVANPRLYRVHVDAILSGHAPNVRLEPGDVVYVPKDNASEYNVFVRKLLPTAQLLNLIGYPLMNANSTFRFD